MSDTDMGPDDTLSPSESTDSDEIANDDGDEVVDPPEDWHAADRPEPTGDLESRLAAEIPDTSAGRPAPPDIEEDVDEPEDVDVVHPDDVPEEVQLSGPQDEGDSFFSVE
ncbi:hypothetical protein [Mycolicibacterium setense]|uniref:hypothetical protein n=1 Tax=Mycolicibacterium setense TaxID=431269 RepID=UPI00057547AF|nr:hypothetical protein [Mycolicibacterium setense]KHO25257.1 hypothetical protein QQ25_01875 [Mycolicibacterium setense]MCV7110272.1 hypothetical protein [Mycolicibacterium setense]